MSALARLQPLARVASQTTLAAAATKVSSAFFYNTFRGHEAGYLQTVLSKLKERHSSIVYLAGDSSLDNKYWLKGDEAALNGYEEVLEPPRMKADVCYWLNHFLQEQTASGGASMGAMNTAVEATTLRQRTPGWTYGGLLEQDELIRDNLTSEDYLVVSVGGNDIALAPTPLTIASMLAVVRGSSIEEIQAGTAPGMKHFLGIYGWKLEKYISSLVSKSKPKKVVVCMLYYPQVGGKGWADTALKALRYHDEPALLQAAISTCFTRAVSQIRIEGTEVVPLPLFKVLDGSDALHYIDRVEPSTEGGRKMAESFVKAINGEVREKVVVDPLMPVVVPPLVGVVNPVPQF